MVSFDRQDVGVPRDSPRGQRARLLFLARDSRKIPLKSRSSFSLCVSFYPSIYLSTWQLARKGTMATAVSLPCGVLLGLLSSFTAAAMGKAPVHQINAFL